MMHAFIPFLEILLLLLISGTALALILLPEASMTLALALGLPLGTFTNVLLIFTYTVLGIALTPVTIILGHLAIVAVLMTLVYLRPIVLMDLKRPEATPKKKLRRLEIIIVSVSLVIIAANTAYSAVHALLLPTAQYDSTTNWTMRSQISFVDHRIAFDPTEIRGMAKPQYPFLFHSLQITANQGQPRWNDTVANAILYLLSLSTFGALFLMLSAMRGRTQALAAVTAIIAIPLIGMHLAQGYGDLNLLQYLLLSLACLGLWTESQHPRKGRWLVLSAVFVAASVWTKSEGSVFGLLPWLLTLALVCGKNKLIWRSSLPAIAVAILLSLPWPIFAWARELSLTPHSSDTLLQLHPEAVKEALMGLFGRGSFGITWYGLIILVPMIVVAGWKHHPLIQRSSLVLLVWGSVMSLEILFIYLCTPNVRFLMNAESFYRQMMVPAAMLILTCAICLRKPAESVH